MHAKCLSPFQGFGVGGPLKPTDKSVGYCRVSLRDKFRPICTTAGWIRSAAAREPPPRGGWRDESPRTRVCRFGEIHASLYDRRVTFVPSGTLDNTPPFQRWGTRLKAGLSLIGVYGPLVTRGYGLVSRDSKLVIFDFTFLPSGLPEYSATDSGLALNVSVPAPPSKWILCRRWGKVSGRLGNC